MNLPKRYRRALRLIMAAALCTALAGGCALPAHTRRLDTLLEQEAVYPGVRYGYRCTAGAHRGASVTYRENTLAALKAADADRKYAFIEFDVQYSRDRRIVVFHDTRLLRLFGSLKAIGDTDFPELVEITHGEIAAYDEVIGSLAKKNQHRDQIPGRPSGRRAAGG